MFKNKFVLGIIAVGIGVVLFYMFGSAPTYAEKAQKHIEEYKKNLISMEGSPIEKLGTSGITFFEPDEKWVFEAEFEKSDKAQEFRVQMTDSTFETSKLAGYATLVFPEGAQKVLIFDEGANYLFPFRDASNGDETYGGGRYINIPKGNLVGNKLTVDFNQAHNFYCAYDEKFICPIPPRENILEVKILAGEKNFKK